MFGELQDMLLEPSSIAGLPGISIPCGFDKNNMPIGLDIMCPQKREDLVYQLAKIFESNTEYHLKRPKL
jgi:aspartyl-tRNA(Asn)/glutamyl-tRNA(Gln) amidotransferase subunit A